MIQSGEDASLSPVGAKRVSATIYEHFSFTHEQVRAMRRWYRVTFGITVNDRRKLCKEFLREALKNQWARVDATDPERPPPE